MNQPFKVGAFLCAWHENPPFRRIGYASDIVRLRHTGWYCSAENWTGEIARGVVYRLNRGRGFIAAMEDPHNHDGPAILELNCIYDDESDAANAADSLAEHYAEDRREEDEIWQAGIKAGGLETEAREHNAAALQIFKERRSLLATLARLERDIVEVLEEKRAARRQRDKIRDEIPSQHRALFSEAYSCA